MMPCIPYLSYLSYIPHIPYICNIIATPTIHTIANIHAIHTIPTIHTKHTILSKHAKPDRPYTPYIPNVPYHTPTTPQGGRGTVPHPHHTTGGEGEDLNMGPIPCGGGGGAGGWQGLVICMHVVLFDASDITFDTFDLVKHSSSCSRRTPQGHLLKVPGLTVGEFSRSWLLALCVWVFTARMFAASGLLLSV